MLVRLSRRCGKTFEEMLRRCAKSQEARDYLKGLHGIACTATSRPVLQPPKGRTLG